MLSKNNRLNGAQRQEKYALRKLSIGVASVLISTTVYLGVMSGTALADANNGQPVSDLSIYKKLASPASQANPSVAPTTASTQPASSATTETPEATDDVNHLIQNGVDGETITTEVQSFGDKEKNVAGSTSLTVTIKLSSYQVSKLKAGSYFDVRLGLPYTVQGDGQQAYLSYGNVNSKGTGVLMAFKDGNEAGAIEVGKIVPMGANNSYLGTRTDADNPDGPDYVHDITNDDTRNAGGTNSFYRIIFNQDVLKFKDSGFQTYKFQLNWFNTVTYDDQWAAPLDPEHGSTHLFSNDETINSITGKGDIRVGDYVTDSNLAIPVTHVQQIGMNDDNDFRANTSTQIAAHWWYKDETGKWTLGYQPIVNPSQNEGISLSKDKVGNEFAMTVSVPKGATLNTANNAYEIKANGKIIRYYFVNGDDVQKELEREIVGKTTVKSWDPTIQNGNVSVGYQIFDSDKPKVEVTQEPVKNVNGRFTVTYHVKIDGDYAGFRKDRNPGARTDYPSTVTLISWAPDNPYDLFPDSEGNPKDTDTIVDYNSNSVTWIEDHKLAPKGHVGGVSVNHNLIKVLDDNPWYAKVTVPGSKDNILLPTNTTNKNQSLAAGYQFVKNGIPLYFPGTNVGVAWPTPKPEPVEQKHTVRQFINYYMDRFDKDHKFKTTKSWHEFYKPGDQSTWNVINPSHDNEQDASFINDPDFPRMNDYNAYLVDEHGQHDETKPITEVGFQDWFRYDGSTYTFPDGQNHDGKTYSELEKEYGRISYLTQRTNGPDDFVINVLLVKKPDMATGSATLKFVDVSDKDHPKQLGEIAQVSGNVGNSIVFTGHENDLANYLAQNYKYVGAYLNDRELTVDDDLPADEIYQQIATRFGAFEANKTKNFVIALKRTTEPDSETKTVSQNNTVHETIHYIYEDGSTAAPDYVASPIEFTRSGSENLTTGVTTWNDWIPASGTFSRHESPEIAGYTPDQVAIEAQSVDANSSDLVFTVIYRAKDTPKTPDKPTNPTNPEQPVTPDQPTKPTNPTNPDQPVTPDQPTNPKTPDRPGYKPSQPGQTVTTAKQKAAAQLPQTGDSHSESLIALAVLSFLALFGLGNLEKRH